MPKKKLKEIADSYEVDFQEALDIVKRKIPADHITGRGLNTWLTEEACSAIDDGLFIDDIIPKNYSGKVLSECPNKKFNYVYSKEIKKRVPVLMPRKLRGKMVGKNILFEGIENETGISYRYVKR